MFERFTDRARRVVVLAQEEARMLNHAHIGTEHLLLAILDSAPVVQLLPDRSALRPDVEERLKHSDED